MNKPDYTALLDADIHAYLANCAMLASNSNDLAAIRRAYRKTCAYFDTPLPNGVAVSKKRVNGVETQSYRPAQASEVQIIYYHGGGFVLGDLDTHHSICGDMAAATGMAVCAVNYRLAPEHPHPAALHDALAVFDAQTAPTLLVGDSAGATLAAAVAYLRPGKAAGMALIYPWLGVPGAYPSFAKYADAPVLTAAGVLEFERLRLNGAPRPNDPGYFPLMASDFSALPPCHISTAEYDPLTDEGTAYHRAILAADGKSSLVQEPALMHGHLRARHVSARANAAFARFCIAIRTLPPRPNHSSPARQPLTG